MDIYENIASVGGLIGDITRTTILASLADGRSLTAGELSRITKVSPQTASSHLSKLVDGGLLVMQAQGRHRYYRLSSSKVADIIEAIAAITPPAPVRSLRQSDEVKALRFARTCYEHLAGRVGVELTSVLVAKGYFEELTDTYRLTEEGSIWLKEFGITVEGLHRISGAIPRHIDWTERHHHLGGPIAVGITRRLIELAWIERGTIRRSIQVTETGLRHFQRDLGLIFPDKPKSFRGDVLP